MEEWKDIKRNPLYEISTKGKVRLKRNGHIMTLEPNSSRYLRVYWNLKGKRERHFLHRLVAETFVPNPDNLPEVDHIDRDYLNNSAENLRWVSRLDQMANIVRLKGKKNCPYPNVTKCFDGWIWTKQRAGVVERSKKFPTAEEAYAEYRKRFNL